MLPPYRPLYIKHRPQSFADLVGQRSVAKTLENAIDHDRISHAYLFTGPRGTGKTSSARILAKSLNCQNGPTKTPCQTCTQCIEITQGTSPAVFEIDAASNNSVDDARVLIERAPLVAQGGRFKLYIIDECHMLTKEAFNALLKTIEEPPPKVVFVLATTEEHKVPPTIVSRCQRLMFRLVHQSDLTEHLKNVAEKENISIDASALDLIARRSGGGLRDALGLLDQASLLQTPDEPVTLLDLLKLLGAVHEDILLRMSEAVAEKNGGELLQQAGALIGEGREPALIALELAKHFLNLAKASYASTSSISELILGSPSYLEGIQKQAVRFDRAEMAQIVEQLDRLEQMCRRASQPALTLEMGLISVCHRHDILMVKELAQRVQQLEAAIAQEGGVELAKPLARPAPKAVAPQASQPVQAKPPSSLPAPALQAQPVLKAATATVETQEEPHEIRSIIELAETPMPVAVSEQETAAAAAEPLGSEQQEGENHLEIEELWSELLEHLRQKHIPTFSLISTHAFPLSLERDVLTLGVMVENFQKMIENKADHVKNACQALGKNLTVRVKVASQPVHTAAPRERQKGAREATSAETATKEDAAEPDAEGVIHTATKAAISPAPALPQAPFQAKTLKPAQAAAPIKPLPQAPPPPSNTPASGRTLIQEAYRLFEGPGSRHIT